MIRGCIESAAGKEYVMAVFLESLRVMLLGMIGIFSVTLVLTGLTRLLIRLFPAKDE